ncbi:VOC family protein [Flexithrix dorotheae]|uniref:VOC family protein n=1 Tax=Flexithrix dorotheae TaxID=70993 RepID=UPI00037A06AE|nr:VOC family protein [Flexithrix dorotheae]
MTTINPYLTFNGNCEEAFNFYKSVFGGEFPYVGRYGEMPPQEGIPPMTAEQKNKIMHISLPISKETTLMGSDTGGDWASNFKEGTNFSISINTDQIKEADRLFTALSEEGKVKMPMNKTFWGSYFGMLTDKFGINWMISGDEKQ